MRKHNDGIHIHSVSFGMEKSTENTLEKLIRGVKFELECKS